MKKTVTLTNAEIREAKEGIAVLEDEKLGGDLVWAVVNNSDELDSAIERYQKAYEKFVQDQVVRDDEGNPVYPEGTPEEKKGQVDPLFEDKVQLVQDINGLLNKEVDLEIEVVEREDIPTDLVTPKTVKKIKFMVKDL